MRVGLRLISIALTVPLWLAAPASGGDFSFSTGNPDGRLGALSRPASPGKIETETADDFPLTETTVITGATGTAARRTSATRTEEGKVLRLGEKGGDGLR